MMSGQTVQEDLAQFLRDLVGRVPGIASGGERGSPWEIAGMPSLARSVMPPIESGSSAGHDPDAMPRWYAAAGGNRIFGALASMPGLREKRLAGMVDMPGTARVAVVNRMPLVASSVRGLAGAARRRREED